MGKTHNKKSGLGKQLIKDRFKKHNVGEGSFLHTSDLKDGFEWEKYNASSVTEESNLSAFLADAQLAGREFTAERLNAQVVTPTADYGVLNDTQAAAVRAAHAQYESVLRVPRRPPWDASTTPEQQDQAERTAFLDWRRRLAELAEQQAVLLTPFERNLEFWRQLWRVVERSDIIVQIVDARQPTLFRSADLEEYVHEVGANKVCVLLMNKADYLSDAQRAAWRRHYAQHGVTALFWSAVREMEHCAPQKSEDASSEEEVDDASEDTSEDEKEVDNDVSDSDSEVGVSGNPYQPLSIGHIPDNDIAAGKENVMLDNKVDESLSEKDELSDCTTESNEGTSGVSVGASSTNDLNRPVVDKNRLPTDVHIADSWNICDGGETSAGENASCDTESRLLSGEELISMLRSIHTGTKATEGITTIGLVGYPNVGKSSTINALLRCKKVPVSSTPGRTKHFQTLFLDKETLLCDCPGLVMPSLVVSKAEMVLAGILPIDRMREYVPPVATLCRLIDKKVLETTYGLLMPMPREGEDPNRPPTAHELLHAYGLMRGYMSHKGIPDYHRSARCILKDFVKGKLLYCHPPPGVTLEEFGASACVQRSLKPREEPNMQKLPKGAKVTGKYANEVDREFFYQRERCQMGVQGRTPSHMTSQSGVTSPGGSDASSLNEKPWKRHGNRGKKDKLRRVHAHLDVI